MMSTLRTLVGVLLVSTLFAPTLQADVASVTVVERRPLADGHAFGASGPYEEIVGTITFAVDPDDPLNQVIVNLDRAPRNGKGVVEATADLVILTPADPGRGNGVALVDIANRGRRSALAFNRGGTGPYGDGFLMNEGYTVVWVGWEFDVAPDPDRIRIDVPSVDGYPVGGLGFVRGPRHRVVDQARPGCIGDSGPYVVIWIVAERSLSADFPLSGLQHRRVRSTGV